MTRTFARTNRLWLIHFGPIIGRPVEGQDSEGGQAAAGAVVEVTAQPIGAGFRKDAGVTWTKNGLWEARNGELRRPPKAAGGSGVLVLDSEFGGAWVWAGQLAGEKDDEQEKWNNYAWRNHKEISLPPG